MGEWGRSLQWSKEILEGKTVATKEELSSRDEQIAELQAQINELRQGRGYSKEDVERMVEQHLANLAKR